MLKDYCSSMAWNASRLQDSTGASEILVTAQNLMSSMILTIMMHASEGLKTTLTAASSIYDRTLVV